MPKKAIARLLEGLRRPSHEFRSSLQVFPDLDVDRVAAELKLAEKGVERGRRDEPSPEAPGPDEVELAVVERVESEKRRAHASLVDETRSYAERLSGLDFEGRFSAIRQAAPETLGEFRTEAAAGRDELFGLRRDLREVEQERDAFKREHGITRAARRVTGGSLVLKIGVLLVLFAVEVALNGAFLAKGNELGLLGGAVEAVAFAALNIGVAYLVATHAVRQVVHRAIWRKALGAVGLAAYVAFAFAINLALAHYREVSGTLAGDACTAVIERIAAAPFGLTDLKSWLFLAIGLLFSAVAFVDALLIHDPYPGYGEMEGRVVEAHGAYTDARADLTDRLREIRDESMEALREAGQDLTARRAEHDAIQEARQRLARLFDAHQDHLERVGQALLARYREANSATRKAPRPPHWNEPFRLARLDPRVEVPSEAPAAREEMRRGVEEALAILARQMDAIQAEFEKVAGTYREIDALFPEPSDADPVPQAA